GPRRERAGEEPPRPPGRRPGGAGGDEPAVPPAQPRPRGGRRPRHQPRTGGPQRRPDPALHRLRSHPPLGLPRRHRERPSPRPPRHGDSGPRGGLPRPLLSRPGRGVGRRPRSGNPHGQGARPAGEPRSPVEGRDVRRRRALRPGPPTRPRDPLGRRRRRRPAALRLRRGGAGALPPPDRRPRLRARRQDPDPDRPGPRRARRRRRQPPAAVGPVVPRLSPEPAMFRAFTAYALRDRAVVLAALLLFAGAGVAAFRHLPVEAYPDVTNVQVQIITLFPGHAAEEVEQLVTVPVENEMNGIPKRAAMRSISLFGLSVVTLVFEDDADPAYVRNQAFERLQAVDLPAGARPGLSPDSTPVGEIYRYTLRAPRGYSLLELKALEDWVVERRLRTVPGVVDVVGFGGPTKQYQVLVDPLKLKSYGITLKSV